MQRNPREPGHFPFVRFTIRHFYIKILHCTTACKPIYDSDHKSELHPTYAHFVYDLRSFFSMRDWNIPPEINSRKHNAEESCMNRELRLLILKHIILHAVNVLLFAFALENFRLIGSFAYVFAVRIPYSLWTREMYGWRPFSPNHVPLQTSFTIY